MARVKICGLTDERGVDAAAEAGAHWAGFVHFSPSPRHLSLERAGELADRAARAGLETVLVTVDPDRSVAYALQDNLMGLGALQLHGNESTEEIEWLKGYTARRVIKAIPVRDRANLQNLDAFAAADTVLLDAKAPDDADRPGGHGAPFDWSILSDWASPHPWILSGGLTPENVADAIRVTGADAVDVSSGVESKPGVKDPSLIARFCAAAHATESVSQ